MFKSTANPTLLAGFMLGAILSVIPLSATARVIEKKDNNSDQVKVTWTDPEQFTELRYERHFQQPRPETWLVEFQKTLVRRGDHVLQPGQHLEVTITDVKLAGRVEPWHGGGASEVRVVKSIYPPQIKLSFNLTDKDGRVLDSGERTLRDTAFLSRGTHANGSDTYRFEKRMLKEWVDKEFGRKSEG
jgi:hypothetical protein